MFLSKNFEDDEKEWLFFFYFYKDLDIRVFIVYFLLKFVFDLFIKD